MIHRSMLGLVKFPLIVLLFVAIVSTGSAHGDQSERWAKLADPVFQHYTPDNGLPNLSVTALAQDGDGFIWVGTQDGVARWDGYRFRSYKPDRKDPTALPDNSIVRLHVDLRGRLWIGTSAGGLARYDRNRDGFVTYAATPGGLSNPNVTAIADDGRGGLWVGTGGGLDHLDPETGTIRSLHHDESTPGSLPAGQILAVLTDRGGRLWVGTDTGLARRDADTDAFVPVSPDPAGLIIQALFEDDHGRIWIGTQNAGAYVADPADGKLRPIDKTDMDGAAPPTSVIGAIDAGIDGEVWLGTDAEGIFAVDTTTRRIRRMGHVATLPSSLASNGIWALLRDRTRTMWVGGLGGLDRLTNGDDAVLTVFGASGRAGSITGADVASVLTLADGRSWVGFYGGGGIDIIDPAGTLVTSLLPDPARPETALPARTVDTMAAVGDAVYIGTGLGLYRATREGAEIQRVAVPQRDPRAYTDALLADDDNLWIGDSAGVWKASLRDGVLSLLDRWGGDRLTDAHVRVLQRGTAHDLWIGTLNGLNRLDLATGTVDRILADLSDPTALENGNVTSLLVDRQDRLWVGTSDGIAVLVGRGDDGKLRFHRLSVADGLPDANIDMLLQDTEGKIWASTDDGLAIIDPVSFAVRALHRAEGAAIRDNFVASGATTPRGELLFGGIGGLTVVRPERLKDWSDHPPVVVTDARVGGKPVLAGRFNGTGSTDPLVIAPEANSLAVEFSALDYTAPELNRYAYRLQGYDKDWIETDPTRRLAAYTNLPPASYTLRLRGSNRNGEWTEKVLDLPIRVLPAWHQSLWFRLVLAVAALAAVAALVQIRTAYLRRRQRELVHQVELRTAEVVHQKEIVERRNIEVEHQKAVAEEQKEVAELAHRNISQLSEVGRQVTASLDPEAIIEMLYRQVETLMDASVFAIGRYHPDREVIEFARVMERGERRTPHVLDLAEPSVAGWCLHHRREVVINDLAEEFGGYADSLEGLAADGDLSGRPVSMIYVPLLVKDRVLGVIDVQSYERNAYTPIHLDMLRTLASYAAVALDNAEAYHELQQAQTQLVQQEKLASLGQLVAGVAHEVNTPVGVALAASTQITDEVDRFDGLIAAGQLRRADLDDFMTTLHELADLLARNCTRAGSLIQSFKAVAADRRSDERRRFGLRAYVKDVINSLEPTLNRSQVEILITGADAPTIDSYPGMLSQVIINLVTNALTHAFEPEGRGVVTIHVGTADAAHAQLIVRDDGKGIQPDILPKIFDPFFTTRRSSGGTGLGLHIVHNLVTGALGGTISVETTPASGTSFVITLPLTAPMAD